MAADHLMRVALLLLETLQILDRRILPCDQLVPRRLVTIELEPAVDLVVAARCRPTCG